MKTNRIITTSFALVLIASAGIAGASPEKKQHRDPDVLRGPKVTDTTTNTRAKKRDAMTDRVDKQVRRDQRPGKAGKNKPGADHPIQFRDYVLALRGIKSRNANIAGLDLSVAQKDQIRMILENQREAMRTFREQNKEQMQALRQRVRDGDRADEARKKLRDFSDNAGPTRDALAKLKQVLTPEQQTTLKSHIKSARAKRTKNAQRPNQNQPALRPGNEKRQRKLQDSPQTQRPQTERPQQHRKKMNPDRVRNTGPKSDKAQRHGKRSKPAPKDD